MELGAIKKAMAGLEATMFVLDRTTHLPTTQHIKSFAEAPVSLPEGDLPIWINFAGPGTYPWPPDRSVQRLAKETRDFIACLYVLITQAGIPGEAERVVEPYMEIARNLFQSHPLFYDGNISDIVPGIMQAGLVRDDGVVVMNFGNQKYIGLRYTVRVLGENEVIYGNE